MQDDRPKVPSCMGIFRLFAGIYGMKNEEIARKTDAHC